MPDYKKKIQEANTFFDDSEAALVKSVEALQIALYAYLTAQLINQFDVTEGGIIKGTKVNLANNVDKLWESFNKNNAVPVAQQFANDLLQGVDYNINYYKSFADNTKRFNQISTDVKSLVQERLGITKAGNLVEDGFIERFVTDETIKNQIKQATFNAVTGGIPLDTFQEQLKTYITGDSKVLGAFEKHYQTFAYDEYQRVDNIAGKVFADKLGLPAAIYEGGLIKDSRDFCRERNGKVFTREEILKFGTSEDKYGGYTNKRDGQFQGKSKPYNPVSDLGGYRCRHRFRWISKTLAIHLRPDLEEVFKQAA